LLTLEAELEARRAGEGDQEYKPLRRGWFVGDQQFGKPLLAKMADQVLLLKQKAVEGEWAKPFLKK